MTESGVRAELPGVRTLPDNPIYIPYERSAEEVTIVGWIWRFARET